jgi:photosynthetic reaction center cytochrome c subunit
MRLIALSLLVSLPLCVSSFAQDKGEKAKVLKIKDRSELRGIMASYTAGLGVQCTFCHVQGNFPSDDNPKKDVARMMITMVDHINAGFPDGKVHVTCYTCHRGEAEPKTAPEPKAQ